MNALFANPLKGLSVSTKIFFGAKLHFNKETPVKSAELISMQRKLINKINKQGYEFINAGNVRAQKVGNTVIFKEKGVDVRIAVDMVAMACDKKVKTIILCSSDSDLQPAVAEARKRKVEVIYLGFENSPNKGLSYTTNRTILIRNSEVRDACIEEKEKKK